MSNQINKHQSNIEFEKITLSVDSFNDKKGINSIMPIFNEEQPITWNLFKDEITENNPKSILDVGCGSGFWALVLKKNLANSKVMGIDKNPKAIEYACNNAKKNNLEIELIESSFQNYNFNRQKFDLITLTPPYHIYPYHLESHIPLFARGGFDGQQEFFSQLKKAEEILAINGIILYNIMCVGDHNNPNYVGIIQSIFKNLVNIKFVSLLPPIPSKDFINGVYSNCDDIFLKTFFADKNPKIYYHSGIIKRDKRSDIQELNVERGKLDFDWQTRIALHRDINTFSI